MRIKALRNIRIFLKGKYYLIKKDQELPTDDILISDIELKTLSGSPAFKKVTKDKAKKLKE